MTFTTEAKAGLLVLAALGSLFWAVRRTSGMRADEGTTYVTELDSAAGLAPKSRVQIAGVNVGEVVAIEERDGKARVTIRVNRKGGLPAGSTLTTEADNMLGDSKIRIIPGPGEGGLIEPGGHIPAGAAPASIDSVIQRVDAIAQNLEAITGTLRETVGSDRGEERLERILEDLAILSANLAHTSSQNRESVDAIIADLRDAAPKVDSSLASIDSIAGKIDRGEGTVGRLVNDEETVDAINQAVGGVNDVLDSYNRLRVFVDYQGEVRIAKNAGEEAAMKNQFLFRLQPHADYGYLIGVSDDPLGSRTRRTTRTVIDGVESVVETEKTTDDFLMTAQIFRRWGPVTGRIGLKEGSGGIGADAWMYRDKLKLSVDAYQFSREKKGLFGATRTENPRLRAQLRYNLYDHLFVVGGGDDLISSYDRRSFFVGAGFEFNDDDLKYVLGSMPRP